MRVNSSPFHAGDIQKCRIPAWSFKSLRLSPGWMNYRNSCDNPLEWAFFRAEVNVGHHLTSSSADLSSSFPDCPLPWLVWIMWLSRDQLPPSPPAPNPCRHPDCFLFASARTDKSNWETVSLRLCAAWATGPRTSFWLSEASSQRN